MNGIRKKTKTKVCGLYTQGVDADRESPELRYMVGPQELQWGLSRAYYATNHTKYIKYCGR